MKENTPSHLIKNDSSFQVTARILFKKSILPKQYSLDLTVRMLF